MNLRMIPDGSREIVARRKRFSKVYSTGRATRILQATTYPIHYQAGGQWTEFAPEWVENPDGSIESKGQSSRSIISYSNQSFSWRVEGQDNSVARGVLSHIGDRSVSNIPGLLIANPDVLGRDAHFHDVVPGLDIFARLFNTGVSWNLIVKNESAPRSANWIIEEDTEGTIQVSKEVYGHDHAFVSGVNQEVDFRRTIEVENPIPDGVDERSQPGKRQFVMRAGWTGRVQSIDPVTRIRRWDGIPVYPIRIDPIVTDTVAIDNNDGDSRGGSSWTAAGSLHFSGGRRLVGSLNQVTDGGVRFETLDIPRGANIISAIYSVGHWATALNTPYSITVFGDDVDDAPAWSDSSLPSNMTRTTASAVLSGWTASTQTDTIDVTSIVQEIINRSGWVADNDLRIGFFSDSAYTSGSHNVGVFDYNTWHTPSDLSTLTVTYSLLLPPNSLALSGVGK